MMLKIQFHAIARTDDITNIEMGDLRSHNKFGAFALQTKVSWSKKSMQERSCPDQIFMCAADTGFCILIYLACYLKIRISSNRHGRNLVGYHDDDMEPYRANSWYCNALRKYWAEPECVALLSKIKGSLGSHSNRKFPAMWCAENGCTDPEVGVRVRWKGGKNGRMVNRSISVEQLTTDAKLACVLVVGGPIRYKLKDDSHVRLQFLKSIVASKMHEHFGADPRNCIMTVLALPFLLACHEPSLAHLIHPQVLSRVR
jgi:hypothetical protein